MCICNACWGAILIIRRLGIDIALHAVRPLRKLRGIRQGGKGAVLIESDERRPSAQMAGRLAEILAVPPAERPAFLRFARGNWAELPAENGVSPPWRANSARRSHLPAAVTALIGRAQDIALVRGYLQDPSIRLVTLVGRRALAKPASASSQRVPWCPISPPGFLCRPGCVG